MSDGISPAEPGTAIPEEAMPCPFEVCSCAMGGQPPCNRLAASTPEEQR